MKNDCILIRYGELALKGKNQNWFIQQLIKNIRTKIKQFDDAKVTRQQGRLFIELNGHDVSLIVTQLKDVFGIVAFSPARRIPNDIQVIEEAVLDLVSNQPFHTFKVAAKRANKHFPVRSQEMNQQMGSLILSKMEHMKVDVHQPELYVHIEVRERETYVYGNDIAGLGGLPVGASGKVMLFLSGGIDSPVAGYLALKRGAELACIHFHSYPFTSKRARQKVIDLAKILTRYAGPIRLYMVPFTDVQVAIKKECAEPYLVTIMRRMMVRIADELAKEYKIPAFVTGESLGQVASQTLEGLTATNNVTTNLILRPLIGSDKQEIISLAKQIGTYETSILPYEDCCTVFLPKNPKTKPAEKWIGKEEKKLDITALIQGAVSSIEVIELTAADESITE